MAQLPWMPFYVADYLADTGHLSTLEHGAYLLLITHYWQHGGLPKADAQLARIARMSLTDWQEIRPIVHTLFKRDWTHGRIEKELAEAADISSKRSAAGKAGANARYSKRNGKRKATVKQTNAHLPSPIPIPNNIDTPDRIYTFTDFWEACPKKTDKGAAEKAWEKAVDLADPKTLVEAMKKYAELQSGKDQQFTKTPGPWLNAKKWLDEGIAPAAPPDEAATAQACAAWNGEAGRLVAEIGLAQFNAYFADARFEPGFPPLLFIPKPFLRDRIEQKYGSKLRHLYGEIELRVAA